MLGPQVSKQVSRKRVPGKKTNFGLIFFFPKQHVNKPVRDTGTLWSGLKWAGVVVGASPGPGGPGKNNINSIYRALATCLTQVFTGVLI